MPKKKIKIRQKARVKKRNEQKDTLKQMPIKSVIPDNGSTLKLRLKKK